MGTIVSMTAGEATIFVETDESIIVPTASGAHSSTSTNMPAGFIETARIDDVRRSFDEVTELITSCCNELHRAIASIPKPESVSIEFGVKLGGEAGVPLLTKATSEATFKVSVVWKNHDNGK